MIKNLLAISLVGFAYLSPFAKPTATPTMPAKTHVLARHSFSLADRYRVASVNEVFKDNILLTLRYMAGATHSQTIAWDDVKKPFAYTFTLQPRQTFAFHNEVLPQYKASLVKTTNADFSSDEGFASDGYLVGDGVCHLASFINLTAKDAGLDAYAPTRHDFATIPEVAKEYGVAIYDTPDNLSTSENQNLYVTNNQNKPVTFTFIYKNDTLQVVISEGHASA